jgi:16S rRNA processing protein RimM
VQNELVEIGYVIRTHGVKGHLRIAFDEYCKELSVSEALYFLIKGAYMPYFIREITWFDNGDALVLLEELNNREEADLHTKRAIYGPAEYLAEPEDEDESDESYVGYHVIDSTMGAIGEVMQAMDMGSYLLLTVEHAGREVLIPLHPNLIKKVDDQKLQLYTELPQGLLEL